MGKLKKVLIMAGGTGGHVFPGLAVATILREQGVEVHWLGTSSGLEAKVVPEAGIPLHTIAVQGVRGKGLKQLLMAPMKLLIAVKQAVYQIRSIQPDIVIGMGGFASGPGGIASFFLGIPLVIHEQNATAGMTNRGLGCLAKRILQGFPNTFAKGITIGNPVRKEIENLPEPLQTLDASKVPLHLLVLGGSLGAQAINELLPAAIALLPQEERPMIYHQSGDKHYEKTKKAYTELGVTAEITPFIKEIDKAYAWADLVLCRAGALTIAELCAAGKGGVLVPYPHAVDDHQTANGEFMVKAGAALMIQQHNLTSQKLSELLHDFYVAREKCFAMGKAAYTLRKVNAAQQMVKICQEVLH